MKRIDLATHFAKLTTAIRRNSSLLLELAVIALVGIGFSLPLLNMNNNFTLTGNEMQFHVGQTQLLLNWLNGKSDFPLWNPAIVLGRSWVSDPFLFVYNPFITLPMWLLGLNNGVKAAVAINFLIAGYGMWVVTRLLGFRWPTRLWASGIYMLSGAIVSHLLAGQQQLVFSLGWLPWSFAGLLWVWKKKTYTSAAVASLAQALFFFTGHLYHQVYAGACYIIILVILLVKWRPFKIDFDGLWKITFMGLLTLGLISIQFIPLFMGRSAIANDGGFAKNEEYFSGSQTPVNAVLNYIVSEREFSEADILGKIPFLQESYRYIGISPFLLASILILPAFKRSPRKREIVAITLSFALMLCWTAVRYTFFKDLYHAIPYLSQFRWPGRALSVGAMFIILLGGFGLDELLTRIDSVHLDLLVKNVKQLSKFNLPGQAILKALVLLVLFLAVQDVYSANSKLVWLETSPQLYADSAFRWLHERESEDYTVGIFATSAISAESGWASYFEQFRMRSIGDGWGPAAAPINLGRPESITIEAKYWLLWEGEPLDKLNVQVVDQIGPLVIYETPAFPYAFTVPVGRFDNEPYVVSPDEVQPAASFTRDIPNGITVETDAHIDSILVVTESWYPGWIVKVDGQRVDPDAVSNLLAVPLTAGKHTVTFKFSPTSFWVGLTVSAIAFVALIVILVGGLVRKQRNNAPPAAIPGP